MTSAHPPIAKVDAPHSQGHPHNDQSPQHVRQNDPYAPRYPPFTLTHLRRGDRRINKIIQVFDIPLDIPLDIPFSEDVLDQVLCQAVRLCPELFRSPVHVKFQVDRIDKVKQGLACHRLVFDDDALVDKIIACFDQHPQLLTFDEERDRVSVQDAVAFLGEVPAAPFSVLLRFERGVKVNKRPRPAAST